MCVVDLDPQADLTETLNGAGDFNVFDVLYGGEVGTLGQAVVPTSWDGIDMVPGSQDLVRIDTENLVGAELRLRASMLDSTELQDYDHVLIDLPPALGRLTLNGLIAADTVVIVTEPGTYSVRGVAEFLQTVRKVQSMPYLNPALVFGGIIVNKVSAPLTGEHKFQIEELRNAFGTDVREPYLPLRTAMQDSQSAGTPLTALGTRGAAILVDRFVEHAQQIDGGR